MQRAVEGPLRAPRVGETRAQWIWGHGVPRCPEYEGECPSGPGYAPAPLYGGAGARGKSPFYIHVNQSVIASKVVAVVVVVVGQ